MQEVGRAEQPASLEFPGVSGVVQTSPLDVDPSSWMRGLDGPSQRSDTPSPLEPPLLITGSMSGRSFTLRLELDPHSTIFFAIIDRMCDIDYTCEAN